MATRNGRIYKRGNTYWYEDVGGKRRSLKTRDRGEAQKRAAELVSAGIRRQTPTPASPPVQPPAFAPDPTPQIEGADFAASVGAESGAAPAAEPSHDGEVVDDHGIDRDGLSLDEEMLAQSVARHIAAVSSVVIALCYGYAGVVAKAADPLAAEAMAGAWVTKTRQWVRDDTFSAWTLIIGATVGCAMTQFGGFAAPAEPVTRANAETSAPGAA